MTTTRVGTPNSANGLGLTTLTLTNVQGNNNLLVVGSKVTSTSLQMTAISGPNTAGWTRVGGPYSDNNASVRRQEIWIGVATGVGPYSTTLTFTWSATNSGIGTDYQCLEFSSGYSFTTWTKDNNMTGGQNNAASTTHNFTTLTSLVANDLFIGTMRISGGGTYSTPNGNCFIYVDSNGNPFYYGLDTPTVGSFSRWITDTVSVASYSFCTILKYNNAWEVDGISDTTGSNSSSGTLSLNAMLTGTSAAVSAANGTVALIGMIAGSSATASLGQGTIHTLGNASGLSATTSAGTGTLSLHAVLSGFSSTASLGSGSVLDVAPGVMSGFSSTVSAATGNISMTGMVAGSSATASLGNGTVVMKGIISGLSATVSVGNGMMISAAQVYVIDGLSNTISSSIGGFLSGSPYQPPPAGSQEQVWVELLGPNLVSQGPIQFVTLTASLYYNAVGSWSMLVPYTDALWNMIQSGDFMVNINWRGLFNFGGKCEQPGYQDSIPGAAGAGANNGPFIVLSGADYLGLIANRICYPNPAAAWSAQTAAAADAVSAIPLETAIKHYVNNNIGPGAIAARRNNYLTIGLGQARGSNVSYTVKFGSGVDINLLDVIRALIAQSGSALGVQITRNPVNHNLVFDVYVPRNLTGKAWFSEQLGNLTAIQFYITDPTCTDALVQGSGTNFVSRVATAKTGWNVVEQFIDSSSETDVNNLATTAQQAIATGAAGPSMAATVADIPFLTFGRDYYLGDMVTVEVRPGATYSDVISGVTLTADPSQTPELSVVPVIGNSANATATDQSIIGQLTTRIRALEKKLATKLW